MAVKLFIENARLAFAKGLFEARAMEEAQTKKFGADFILHEGSKVYKVVVKDGVSSRVPATLHDVLLEVANDTWKGKGKEMLLALESSKKCVRDGNARINGSGEVYDGYEGHKYISAKSTTRPTILDKDKSPLTEADGKPYSGCYVNVSLEIYGMSDAKKKGVHASLRGVQFFSDGDAFAGGGSPASADEFDDLGDSGGSAPANNESEFF